MKPKINGFGLSFLRAMEIVSNAAVHNVFILFYFPSHLIQSQQIPNIRIFKNV